MEQANHAKQRSRDAQISDLEIQVSRLTLQNTSLTDTFSQKEVEAVAEVRNLKRERDELKNSLKEIETQLGFSTQTTQRLRSERDQCLGIIYSHNPSINPIFCPS